MKVMDVDGSYLARKHQQLQVDGVNVAPLGVPPIPPSGWNAVSETNFKEAVEKMPKMMSGNKKVLDEHSIIIALPFRQVPYTPIWRTVLGIPKEKVPFVLFPGDIHTGLLAGWRSWR